jgi:hypothetical protein
VQSIIAGIGPGVKKAVQTCLHSNPVEFDGIKIRVIELFPHAQEFHSISVSNPVADEVIGMIGVLFGLLFSVFYF